MQPGRDQTREVGHVDQQVAPTSSAISRKRGKSSCRGYADQPAMIIFGRRSRAMRATSSMSITLVSRVDPVGGDLVELA